MSKIRSKASAPYTTEHAEVPPTWAGDGTMPDPATIKFTLPSGDGNYPERNRIAVYDTGTPNGGVFAIQSGGATVVGAGESGNEVLRHVYDNLSGSDFEPPENLYLTADDTVEIWARQNSPVDASKRFRFRNNGTLDFPNGGGFRYGFRNSTASNRLSGTVGGSSSYTIESVRLALSTTPVAATLSYYIKLSGISMSPANDSGINLTITNTAFSEILADVGLASWGTWSDSIAACELTASGEDFTQQVLRVGANTNGTMQLFTGQIDGLGSNTVTGITIRGEITLGDLTWA